MVYNESKRVIDVLGRLGKCSSWWERREFIVLGKVGVGKVVVIIKELEDFKRNVILYLVSRKGVLRMIIYLLRVLICDR